MENSQNLEQALFEYVKRNTFKEAENLTADTKIFEEGILDSMGFVLLLDFLEENFQIAAEDSDLVEENFESIDAIVSYVQKKLALAA